LAGDVTGMEKKINAYWSFGCKPERKRHLERRGRRWEKNIKIDLKDTSLENVDWIHLVKDGPLL
jgi:hypothetical protein